MCIWVLQTNKKKSKYCTSACEAGNIIHNDAVMVKQIWVRGGDIPTAGVNLGQVELLHGLLQQQLCPFMPKGAQMLLRGKKIPWYVWMYSKPRLCPVIHLGKSDKIRGFGEFGCSFQRFGDMPFLRRSKTHGWPQTSARADVSLHTLYIDYIYIQYILWLSVYIYTHVISFNIIEYHWIF